ncbi:hypothetical protein ACHAPT_005391 [Fusarium lateritium]
MKEKNAKVDVRDARGWTVFHYAAYRGFRETLEVLGAGMPRFSDDAHARMPIHLAVMAKKEAVLDLMARDIDVRDDRDRTPLHLAIEQDSLVLVKLLLKLGASENAKDMYGQTSLHIAALNEHNDIVRSLIEAKVDVNAKGKQGLTPLQAVAKEKGDEETARLLIDAGARVDLVCKYYGRTAMHHAALVGNAKMAAAMLAKERSVLGIRDSRGDLPIHLLALPVRESIVKHLNTPHGIKSCKDMFYMFVAEGADKDATNNHGQTPLHVLSREADFTAIDFGRFLVRQGVRVDVKDEQGYTAEDYAGKRSWTEFAEFLHETMEGNRDGQGSSQAGEGD